MPMLIILIWTLLCLMTLTRCREVEKSILENIKDDDPDYYEQAQAMLKCEDCDALTKMPHITFFVPQLKSDDEIDPYVHMAQGIIEEHDFSSKTKEFKVPSLYPGGYYLQIVKIGKSIYVNGQEAVGNECIPTEDAQKKRSPKGKKSARQTLTESTQREKLQCLYKISKPIEPLRLKEDGMDEKYRKYNQYTNPNPNAWEFIRNFESYKLIPQHDISYFRDRLIATRMTEAYEDFGFEDQDRNFFVPTNGAFLMKKHYTELIDRLIIQNHIVDYGYLFQREVDVDCTAIPESNPVMLSYKQNDTLTWSRNLSSSYSHPLTVTPISMNILLTVFVSNGIVNIIDGVIGIDLKNATHKQLVSSSTE
ncbi:uncharacterized protein ACN427_008905 [Glossina fuscipes fuscipes]